MVQPYKKGPDYIDPMWHRQAAQIPCQNLDFNVQSDDEIRNQLITNSEGADISLIEGNMGMFDSLDLEGCHSNAELAELLEAPVILIVDVQGATRSIVPLIQGFINFDSGANIAGIILNNVAGQRHEMRLREVIGHYIDRPVVGAIHRNSTLAIDERHLGLIPSNESSEVEAKVSQIGKIVGSQVDLELLIKIANNAPAVLGKTLSGKNLPQLPPLRIGIAQDAAFGFYYPDDLQQFIALGAELIPFSPLNDSVIPGELDGLFIGGGFPETHLQQLGHNREMQESIAKAIESGIPCYAECGGLMYLSQSIEWQGAKESMVGIIPAGCQVHKKPIGRGLAQLETTEHHPWPFTTIDAAFPAHEFHYSELAPLPAESRYAYRMVRGSGIGGQADGFIYKNLLANYTHLRSVDATPWVAHFLEFVAQKRTSRLQSAS